jgi:hypothetical protein
MSTIKRVEFTLSCQFKGFRSWETHHNASVRHRLQENTGERRAGSRQSRTSVKIFFVQEATAPDRGEYFEDGGPVNFFAFVMGESADNGHTLANLYRPD